MRFVLLVLAQQQTHNDDGLANVGGPSPSTLLLRAVLMLLFIAGGVWLLRWWAVRRGMLRVADGQTVRVRERVPLDAQRAVYLVDVGERTLLLGASEQQVSLLSEVPRTPLRSRRVPVFRGRSRRRWQRARKASGKPRGEV